MISIVIPTLNADQCLPDILTQLSGLDVQLIISDGFSDDDTLNLAARHGANLALGTAARGAQLQRGAALAQSDWYLFLHADSRLPENWQELIGRHISKYPEKAGFFGLRYDSPKLTARWVELMVGWRSWTFIWGWALPYGDQGLLISKDFYEAVGGYPDWPLFEDVKLVEKIGLRRIRPLGGAITTSSARYEQDGFIRRGWRNFKLLRRYKKGESIESLCKDYI